MTRTRIRAPGGGLSRRASEHPTLPRPAPGARPPAGYQLTARVVTPDGLGRVSMAGMVTSLLLAQEETVGGHERRRLPPG